MGYWLKCIIIVLVFLSFPCGAQEERPFWQAKSRLYKRILERRKIVVSAVDQKQQGQKKVRLAGAGLVNASLAHTCQEIMKFENLQDVSSYFKKVVHKKKERQLYISIRALGYQSRVLLSYKWAKDSKDSRQLDWLVVWGPLKGMVGHFKFKQHGSQQTLVSVWAQFSELQVPIPGFLLKFTLEVIAEKVAQKMRSYIEKSK